MIKGICRPVVRAGKTELIYAPRTDVLLSEAEVVHQAEDQAKPSLWQRVKAWFHA